MVLAPQERLRRRTAQCFSALAGALLVIVVSGRPALAATDPNGDPDHDGVTNAGEAFWGTDPTNPDTDGDGLSDGEEIGTQLVWGIGSPTDPDSDHDGIDDLHDDYDGDGLSNLEERQLGLYYVLFDSDFDGLSDGWEVAHGSNPLAWDSDGDGIRDGDQDDDGDGLGTALEVELGTDPTNPDTDGDGVTDGDERLLCTDPLVADSNGDDPPDALCLSRAPEGVPDWKLFQRDAASRSTTITVPFHYRLAHAARVEVALIAQATGAALSGFGFAEHALTLDVDTTDGGGSGSLVLAGVPQGGNYDLAARIVNPTSGVVLLTDTTRNLAVGDVFLAAGQSNMSGNNGLAEAPSHYEQPDPQVHLFGNDYRWKLATEPMENAANSLDPVGIDSQARSSPMLRFAKEVTQRTGIPVAIMPASSSGSSIMPATTGDPFANHWTRDAQDPQRRTTLYGSALSRVLVQDYASPIRGVIWYQGESDAAVPTADYLATLRQLVSDLRTDLASPALFFASCQLASYTLDVTEAPQALWMGLREAQRQYAASDPQSTLVATLDLPVYFVHLFGSGYRETGRRLGLATLEASYNVRRLGTTPKLRSVRLSRAGARVVLRYDRPVVGGDPALFRVSNASGGVAVLAAQARGSRVYVDLAQPVTAAAHVSYGFGKPASPGGWLVGRRGEGSVLAFKDLGAVTNLAR